MRCKNVDPKQSFEQESFRAEQQRTTMRLRRLRFFFFAAPLESPAGASSESPSCMEASTAWLSLPPLLSLESKEAENVPDAEGPRLRDESLQ